MKARWLMTILAGAALVTGAAACGGDDDEGTAAAGGTVPAVAITAYASANDRLTALSAGYQAHVAKPFEPREIATLVAQLGRHTHSRRT